MLDTAFLDGFIYCLDFFILAWYNIFTEYVKNGDKIMAIYGYHRTSTEEQHLDRGISEITAYCEANGLPLRKIFTDKETGKDFNRPKYQVLREDILMHGDCLIVTGA